jgi:hypothetical protein
LLTWEQEQTLIEFVRDFKEEVHLLAEEIRAQKHLQKIATLRAKHEQQKQTPKETPK